MCIRDLETVMGQHIRFGMSPFFCLGFSGLNRKHAIERWKSDMFYVKKKQHVFFIYLFTPKIGTSCLTGQTCGSHRSDRCGQRP
jgi:hypothetical protein